MSVVNIDPEELQKINTLIKSKKVEIIYNPMIDAKSLKKGEWVIGRPPTSICRWIDPDDIVGDIAQEIKYDLNDLKNKRKTIIYTIYGFINYKHNKKDKMIIYYDKQTKRISNGKS
jgi:hypothetical protein